MMAKYVIYHPGLGWLTPVLTWTRDPSRAEFFPTDASAQEHLDALDPFDDADCCCVMMVMVELKAVR